MQKSFSLMLSKENPRLSTVSSYPSDQLYSHTFLFFLEDPLSVCLPSSRFHARPPPASVDSKLERLASPLYPSPLRHKMLASHHTASPGVSSPLQDLQVEGFNSITSFTARRDPGASDGGISVWSFATRELVLQFHEHKRAVTGVLVDLKLPHRVHSCGLDKALFIYDLKGARRIVAQQVREGAFHGIAQRLDSETEIATAGADGRILFWDCDEQEPVGQIVDPSRLKVTCARISPSGRFLATCGEDCEVKLFDVGSSVLLASARGHSNTVNGLAWSPDERQLVSVGSDSCICVWNFYQE